MMQPCNMDERTNEEKLKDRITELEAQLASKWVSVEADLPKDGQQVLTLDRIGRRYHCTFLRGKFKLMFHCDDHSSVTAWMPLPGAPQ